MQSVIDRLSDNLLEVPGPLVTPCWLWQRSLTGNGYGQIWFDGKLWAVHRLVWFLERGKIPEGIEVCHRCDNRPCGNFDHLFIGTDQDNTDDMIAKGRYFNGRTTKTCTDEDEIAAIKLRLDGYSYEKIGELINVSRGQAWKLINLKKQRKRL